MTSAPMLDVTVLAEVQATMQEKFALVVQYFLEDTETYLRTIREGAATGSAEAIVAPAHTLKSSAGQMGAAPLAELAREVETRARAQASANTPDIAALTPLITALEAALIETRHALLQHTSTS